MKQNFSTKYTRLFFTLLGAMACLVACKKDKLDGKPLQTEVSNASASSIRLFNLYSSTDVTVNNIPLTSRQTNSQNQVNTDIGLAIFPSGKWLAGEDGSPFTLPNSLLDKNGKAHFIIGSLDTTIVNDVEHPKDYYRLANGHLRVVERNNIQPATPQNFKIRILNLGSIAQGNLLDLQGPVTLTYADGSIVDQRLSNIAPGGSSDYIEIPYGTYQFKMFIGNGAGIDVARQLADVPTTAYYDPCNPSFHPQQGINTRVRTFKPGGVYTLLVSENLHSLFKDCDRVLPSGIYANSYRVITELNPGVNSTFARMQAINAVPGKTISVNVDGQALGGTHPYIGKNTGTTAYQAAYQIYVQGKHHVVAKDENGSVLAEADLTLYPYDNYTIWLYNNKGKYQLAFQPNDMSGTLYSSTYHPNGPFIPDDGTNGPARLIKFPYALQSRFINLCADLPYATFTNDHQLLLPAFGPNLQDSIRYFSAYVNLSPGSMPLRNASVIYSLPNYSPASTVVAFGNTEKQFLPDLLRVYSSKPTPAAEVPGSLETRVVPIRVNDAFIANKALYIFPQFISAETGVYTVALVGALTGSANENRAKLIVIKHNK